MKRQVKSVAIIGAGATGIAAAKYLSAEKKFDIHIYEQRSVLGGLWNYTVPSTVDGYHQIPTTDTNVGLEKPIKDPKGSNTFVTPVYDDLEVNIPHPLMGYSSSPFSTDLPLFPRHETVIQYLQLCAQDISRELFSHQVQKIWNDSQSSSEWWIEHTHLSTNETAKSSYDAIVIATGHYSAPFIPDIPGIREWHEQHKNSITHSKYFRSASSFSDKRTLIVGSSASGIDISVHISKVAAVPTYRAERTPIKLPAGTLENPKIKRLTGLVSLDAASRTANFANGEKVNDLDAIVFCTGYLYTFPFFDGRSNPSLDFLTDTGKRMVHGLYEHIFSIANPTLAFLGIPSKIVPFPLSEAQSAVVARVWTQRLTLPSETEMRAWESRRLDEVHGEKNAFHVLDNMQDVKYLNMLVAWAGKAEGEGRDIGKRVQGWGERDTWVRKNIADMRLAWGRLSEDEKKKIRSYDSLKGFEDIPPLNMDV